MTIRATTLSFVSVLLVVACMATAQPALQAVEDGANYLVNQQLNDGGWSWTANGTSASNIAGATGQGLIRAYDLLGSTSYLDASKDAVGFIDSTTYENGETRFATFDPYFCGEVSRQAGDTSYQDIAGNKFFGELQNGTYGPNDYDTNGWIGSVQSARTGTWQNLRPWEFSTIANTARNIGTTQQGDAFRQAILDGLNTLDNTDPDNVYSDLLGVAGGVRGLAMDGVSSFSALTSANHSGINGVDSLGGLADYLAALQNTDGSWYWHSNLSEPGEYDKDTQTTAYAVLALEEAAEQLGVSDYDNAIENARVWLMSMQQNDPNEDNFGAFYSYPGATGFNNEVTGEAIAAIPEPATMGLLGLGGLGVLVRRKRA